MRPVISCTHLPWLVCLALLIGPVDAASSKDAAVGTPAPDFNAHNLLTGNR